MARKSKILTAQNNVVEICGYCEHVVPVTRFHTLSILGLPTLGECPYWNKSRCVLLRQKACEKFKKKRQ